MSNWILSPPGLATLVTVFFLATSTAWVLYDERVPVLDMGRHLSNVFVLREQMLGGDLLAWWGFDTDTLVPHAPLYPPLVYLIGIAGTLIGGVNVDAPVLALNAVGVPLLAVACYRVASIAFDRRAGVLAVLFALGGPMVISQFHLFMVDMTQMAFVAASVWLLFETERFSRPGMSALAGLMTGLALMTKQTSAFFIAPLVAVLLLKGGMRDWRNALRTDAALPLLRTPACGLAFASVALLVALPWYLQHSEHMQDVSEATRGLGGGFARLSVEHLSWHGWALINYQLFLPLAAFFLVGLIYSSYQWLRAPTRADYVPELVVGAIGSVLITALWFFHHDPRYAMPAMVYIAALGTGWIVTVGRRLRIAAMTALVGIFAINTAAVNLGFPGSLHVPTGTAPVRVIGEGGLEPEPERLTVVDSGYVVGPPHKGGEVLDLMRAAADDGVEVVGYEQSMPHLDPFGMTILGRLASIEVAYAYAGPSHVLRPSWRQVYNPALLGDRGMFLVHRPPDTSWGEPCGRMADGGALYVFRGSPGSISDFPGGLIEPRTENLHCPLP